MVINKLTKQGKREKDRVTITYLRRTTTGHTGNPTEVRKNRKKKGEKSDLLKVTGQKFKRLGRRTRLDNNLVRLKKSNQ